LSTRKKNADAAQKENSFITDASSSQHFNKQQENAFSVRGFLRHWSLEGWICWKIFL
jgi:hypothetical protein